jgi:cob(I)alamin adenosyltransferase
MKQKPAPVELIFSGRYCPPQLIAKADLVTEMQEIKHYYQNGVSAREGIES